MIKMKGGEHAMRLDHDLIRDIMLAIERHQGPNKHLKDEDFLNLTEIKHHNNEIVIYHLKRLSEANFLNISFMHGDYVFFINYITYEGHLFIDDIRDPKAWKYAKEKTKEFTSISLPMLAELGKQYVKTQLGL